MCCCVDERIESLFQRRYGMADEDFNRERDALILTLEQEEKQHAETRSDNR